MEMDIFKVAAIGLSGVMISSIVKGYKPEFSTYIVIATVMMLFMLILSRLTSVFNFLESVYNQISYGKNFFPILLKILAVAYIADFTAQICKDSGETAIAGKVELAGKVIIFYLAVPVMVTVLELINALIPT